jgi:hypothetical protein
MKTLLQMEMYYVREYTPTCRLRVPLIISKNLQLKCILHQTTVAIMFSLLLNLYW